MERENRQAGQKNIPTIEEKNCSWSKKENFVNIKNIEIFCKCS